MDEKHADLALRVDGHPEELDAEELLHHTNQHTAIAAKNWIKVGYNKQPVLDDGVAFGLGSQHSLLVTLQKMTRIRWSCSNQIRRTGQIGRQRNPGQAAGREVVGSGGAIVASTPLEKPMKSGL